MAIRKRKLIGAFALIALVVVWSLVAMALAQSALTSISGLVAAIYSWWLASAGCCRQCP